MAVNIECDLYGIHGRQLTVLAQYELAAACVVVGREPSWCRLNSEYHKALAPFFIPS